jgi:hypothetical protein
MFTTQSDFQHEHFVTARMLPGVTHEECAPVCFTGQQQVQLHSEPTAVAQPRLHANPQEEI